MQPPDDRSSTNAITAPQTAGAIATDGDALAGAGAADAAPATKRSPVGSSGCSAGSARSPAWLGVGSCLPITGHGVRRPALAGMTGAGR